MSDANPPATEAPAPTEAPTTTAPTQPPVSAAPAPAGSLKGSLDAAGIGNSEPGAVQMLCSLVDEGVAAGHTAEALTGYVQKEAAQQRISFLQALAQDALHACVTVAASRSKS